MIQLLLLMLAIGAVALLSIIGIVKMGLWGFKLSRAMCFDYDRCSFNYSIKRGYYE